MNEPLHKEVRVRCSKAHAFLTFTDKIDLWWPISHRPPGDPKMRLEAEQGGRFYAQTTAGDEVHLGDVVDCEPPDRILYTWMPGRGTGPTEVEVVFIDEGDTTLVQVEHRVGDSGLGEQWASRVRGFGAAWNEVLPAFYEHITEQE